jgi:hypothetical protein
MRMDLVRGLCPGDRGPRLVVADDVDVDEEDNGRNNGDDEGVRGRRQRRPRRSRGSHGRAGTGARFGVGRVSPVPYLSAADSGYANNNKDSTDDVEEEDAVGGYDLRRLLLERGR